MLARSLPHGLKRALLLGSLVLFGGALRFRHLGWARGYYFQPDENAYTVEYVLRLPSSLNPYEIGPYTYGGLPLYLYYFSSRALAHITRDSTWTDKWHITLIARTCAAAASTATILLVYLLWCRLGSARTASVSALAFAVAPLSIQYAHYGVVDTLLTFWVVLVSLLSVEAWRRNRLICWLAVGLALGLAVATKSSGLVWALVFIVAVVGYWRQDRSWRRVLSVLALGCAGTLAGILLTSPYYLLDWSAFRQVMALQSAKTVTGRSLTTYHWQFLDVTPFMFESRQLARWAIGLPLAVLGLVGMLSVWKRAAWPCLCVEWLFPLVPPTAYFLMIGLWHSKFIRYLLPLIPYVALVAAQPMRIAEGSRYRLVRWGVIVVTVVALLYSALLGCAVSNVYAFTDPRVAASEWMLENIPAGATILHDPEPLIVLPLGHTEQFQIRILDLYGNRMRNINQTDFYVQALLDQQYVVIVSRRHYGAVYHLAALFPQAACYYRCLFNGELGYRLVADFSNYPRLGPFVWDTDEAEETFQVFDHPHVYIFERAQVLDSEQLRSVLDGCGQ
jgi:hypothetical protein